ncbi:AMP-binding protein [Agromyces sp. SYSU T0242]|uniref:AMP-binding protein n=1 Tax=Agromyces litoreus TaxID=3158561 RepID=UPI003393E149
MVRSPSSDIEIPDLSVHEYLFGHFDESRLDHPALIDGTSGAVTTYRRLLAQVDGFAGALAARDVGVGDVVAVLCPNVPAFATVFHGILRAGATATTVNSLYTPDEIASQLDDAGARWLVTVGALLPGAIAAAERHGIPAEQVVVLDGAPGHPSLADLLGEGRTAPEVEFDPATHVAVLPYSSGTTGRPKGVMLTHRNLVANVAQCRAAIGLEHSDRVLAVLPFFHIYGMTVLLNFALSRRASLVTMPRFDLAEFLRVVSEHRATWVFIAPPIAVALAKHPMVDEFDLSSVKVVFSGAAPLDGALAELVAARLGCTVCQGYGMTETSPVTHVIPVDRDELDRSSIGVLLPNTEARVVDSDSGSGAGADVDVPDDGTASSPGELLIRGPQVMTGYLGRPDATADMLDEDGWLHTGDVATVTADGVFRIVDRLKELIKYKGYQVAPAVLEAVLLEHPAIADAAVIGTLDEDGQEVPKAFVVVQAGQTLDEQAVMAFIAERVAPHEKVRAVEFIDRVPKSASGKILRKDLRAREAEARGSGR